MKTRNLYLENTLTLGDSGTKTINLDMKDPITALQLNFGATNGATSNLGNPIIHNITKVEIVDGSDVLYSMPGHILRGLVSTLAGKVISEYPTEQANDTPIEPLVIPFGRYLYDTEFALNPQAFRNLQLKISWNLANVRAVGATGYVTGSLTLNVIAKLMSEVPAPKGFLMTKDIYDFTSVGAGDERIDMPTDYPYRALAVRVYEISQDLISNITNVKLSIDGDKEIPLDMETGDLRHYMLDYFPILEHSIKVRASNETVIETWMGLSLGGDVSPGASGYILGASEWWKSQLYPWVLTHAGVAANNVVTFLTDRGCCFENTFVYPFGRIMDPETWFNVRGLNSLKLYLTNGDAGAAVDVAVQQYRNY